MSTQDQSRGLGCYMQALGRKLTDEPRQVGDLATDVFLPGGPAARLGYAQMTMLRLAWRGVATEVDGVAGLYARGPRWADSAGYYGWPR